MAGCLVVFVQDKRLMGGEMSFLEKQLGLKRRHGISCFVENMPITATCICLSKKKEEEYRREIPVEVLLTQAILLLLHLICASSPVTSHGLHIADLQLKREKGENSSCPSY